MTSSTEYHKLKYASDLYYLTNEDPLRRPPSTKCSETNTSTSSRPLVRQG
jgi:hypothetical protein